VVVLPSGLVAAVCRLRLFACQVKCTLSPFPAHRIQQPNEVGNRRMVDQVHGVSGAARGAGVDLTPFFFLPDPDYHVRENQNSMPITKAQTALDNGPIPV
jgi:hypothetical protein